MTELVLIIIGIMSGIILVIVIDILLAFHNRKCPYCGKRMTPKYQKKDNDGNFMCWVFYCPHCGAWEEVTPEQLNNEKR